MSRCSPASRWQPRMLLVVAIGAASFLAGCPPTSDPAPGEEDASAPRVESTEASSTLIAPEGPDALAGSPPSRVLSPELNAPRSAALTAALWPPLADGGAGSEIAAHQALFREAIRLAQDDGMGTAGFLLRPPQVVHAALTPREYYLRVLASLADAQVPIAWTDPLDESGTWVSGRGRTATLVSIRPIKFRGTPEEWRELEADVHAIGPDGREATARVIVRPNSAGGRWIAEIVAVPAGE